MSIQNFFVAFIHTENEYWERDEKVIYIRV